MSSGESLAIALAAWDEEQSREEPDIRAILDHLDMARIAKMVETDGAVGVIKVG